MSLFSLFNVRSCPLALAGGRSCYVLLSLRLVFSFSPYMEVSDCTFSLNPVQGVAYRPFLLLLALGFWRFGLWTLSDFFIRFNSFYFKASGHFLEKSFEFF